MNPREFKMIEKICIEDNFCLEHRRLTMHRQGERKTEREMWEMGRERERDCFLEVTVVYIFH